MLDGWLEPWATRPQPGEGELVVVRLPDGGELVLSWMDDLVGYSALVIPVDYPRIQPVDVAVRREKTDAGFYVVCATHLGEVWVAEDDVPEIRDSDAA